MSSKCNREAHIFTDYCLFKKLKTGTEVHMLNAIQTTNLQMSYRESKNGKGKGEKVKEKRERMQQELRHWGDRKVIRILVCTKRKLQVPIRDQKQVQEQFMEELKTSRYEYFAGFNKQDTEILFGETFTRMAEAMTPRQDLPQLLETRAKKRKADEDVSVRNLRMKALKVQ